MHQDIFSGYTHIIDSFLIKPYTPIDEFRLMSAITYQKKFKNKFEIEVGVSYSKTYYSYILGLYDSTFNDFTKTVGVSMAHTFTFPINVNFAVTESLYVKAGVSASIGILQKNPPIYFYNSPKIFNDLYNSMHNISKPNSINYGYGVGYKIWRFDMVYFRKVTISKIAKPININNIDYIVYDKKYSNTISIFYNIKLK
jgi:hypothetical protein